MGLVQEDVEGEMIFVFYLAIVFTDGCQVVQ
jgi:hypothetical protein